MSGAKDSFECDVFRGPCHWNTNLILKEINKHAGVLQNTREMFNLFAVTYILLYKSLEIAGMLRKG